MDGVTLVGLPHSYLARLRERRLYRLPRADLFVSVDARFDSWLAMQVAPRPKHAIWLVDPMSFDTYWSQHREDPGAARPLERLATRAAFEGLQAFGRSALRRADAVWSQPRELSDAARRAARLTRPVRFAPNPVEVPEGHITKDDRPLVLFLGRLDWQKQPERFFELARRLPDVDFVAAGGAATREREERLRAAAAEIANLSLPGVVTGETKERLLRLAWILCNTSLREGLPRSFQEGLAHGCALVAAVDPDRLVSRFGAFAADRDFETAVRGLVESGAWKRRGAAGRAYVREHHGTEHALDVHESLYRELVG